MSYTGLQIGRITEYPDGQGGVSRINISGNLLDDTDPEVGNFNYLIESDKVNKLPPAGPGRDKALRNILRREGALQHAAWQARKAAEPPAPTILSGSDIGIDGNLTGPEEA